MLFFGLVYVVEGVGQTSGLIAQPLNYYLKESFGWTPVQVTAYLTILNLLWIIKPIYGIVSDFLPLLGYRQILPRPCQCRGNCGLLLVDPNYCARSADCCSTADCQRNGDLEHAMWCHPCRKRPEVRRQRRFRQSAVVVFNIAALVSGFVGEQLVERLAPTTALHTRCGDHRGPSPRRDFHRLVSVSEPKSRLNLPEMRKTLAGCLAAFGLRDLRLVGVFLFLCWLNPGLVVPLYYHMTDDLKFSQEYIGILGSIRSGGWIAGALLYPRCLKGNSAKALLNLSILFGTPTTASYLLLWDQATAAIINFCSGVAGMIAFVATLTLAADYAHNAPKGLPCCIDVDHRSFECLVRQYRLATL
jgi:hypothetical protein